MLNPDKSSAHEKWICSRLDQIEDEMDSLQDLPATPLNRLKLIQLQFKAQVLLNSWYKKDKDETMEGLFMLSREQQMKRLYQLCLNKVTSIIDHYEEWKDQEVDISFVERWLEEPEAAR